MLWNKVSIGVSLISDKVVMEEGPGRGSVQTGESSLTHGGAAMGGQATPRQTIMQRANPLQI